MPKDNIGEAQITRAMVREFWQRFDDYVESDVIIVGGGPAGLVAAYELGKRKVKTLLIENNNYLGGGMWLGGYLMNVMTVREMGQPILDEFKIPYKKSADGLITADAPLAAAKIIAAACESGAQILNMTRCKDVVVRNNRVEGVVINWSPVDALPRSLTCVDPVAMEAKVVIDATGHDDASLVGYLAKRGLVEVKGMGPMNVGLAEDEIVNNTKEVYPGLIMAGMAASTAFGLHRMGPTFASMFLSGQKAALLAYEKLN